MFGLADMLGLGAEHLCRNIRLEYFSAILRRNVAFVKRIHFLSFWPGLVYEDAPQFDQDETSTGSLTADIAQSVSFYLADNHY
jgi:hypothetical protein